MKGEALYRWGLAAFAVGLVAGLFIDGSQGNDAAVILDGLTLLVWLGLLAGQWRGWWDRSRTIAALLFVASLNFVLAVIQAWSLASFAATVYHSAFILALFAGLATFLGVRWAALLFGAVLITMVTLLWIQTGEGGALLIVDWAAVVGASLVLYWYRGVLDHVLGDLQRVAQENRALRDRERLAALGEMTAGIAHEIKNPLHLVVNFAESSEDLLRDLQPRLKTDEESLYLFRELQQNLADIRSQGLRGAQTVQAMLRQARAGSGEFQAVDLNEVAEECLRLATTGHRVEHLHTDLVVEPTPVLVNGVRADLSRALLNLLVNALWSVAERQRQGPAYQPRIELRVSTQQDHALVVVADNGIGLSSTVKRQMFVPFFSTKPPGQGTGLGLPLTREVIVDQHGGRLEARGEPDQGAEFLVSLPLLGGKA